MRKPYHHGDLKNALIRAGAELLAHEGVGSLTLRRVAARAGVSHSAPYAHFPDKEALVAAISTEGLRVVRERIAGAVRKHAGDPRRQLQEAAWETVRFGLEQPDLYRVTFSNAMEQEHDHPDYMTMANGSFEALVDLVRGCQAAGVVAAGPPETVAVGLWSVTHGLVSLLTNRQIPHTILARTPPRQLLQAALASQLCGEPEPPARRARPRGRKTPRSDRSS
ncbi:MAG: TetR/AcrR family transcriptional regulator [Anaeromyxobacter sp.]